ncbi:MAG: hypothetical protein HYU41_26420 [Candidatus Rokubacteria bacterium]|nr:hypothetical protein [Candidatus Rokubacteria bacterium]
MRSVADDLRREDRAALRKLSASDRVALALSLGERDVDAFAKAQQSRLSREEVVRSFERQRQVGRRPSACMQAIIG